MNFINRKMKTLGKETMVRVMFYNEADYEIDSVKAPKEEYYFAEMPTKGEMLRLANEHGMDTCEAEIMTNELKVCSFSGLS